MSERTYPWIAKVTLPALGTAAELSAWLNTQSNSHTWLLAHTYFGVTWGYSQKNGGWIFSKQVFSTVGIELKPESLMELRLFSPEAELHLWRADDVFEARYIADGKKPGAGIDYYEEEHLLWGMAQESHDGFSLMREGTEGLLHALPASLKKGQRASLAVRHYIEYDEVGQAYIAFSRLMSLNKMEE